MQAILVVFIPSQVSSERKSIYYEKLLQINRIYYQVAYKSIVGPVIMQQCLNQKSVVVNAD